MPVLTSYNEKTVYEIDLNLPPQKRWHELIDETGDQIHHMYADVQAVLDDLYEYVPSVLRPLTKGGGFLAEQLISLIAKWYGEEYVAEIKGMAKYAKLNFPRLLLANLTYDFTQLITARSPSACSSYSFNLPEGFPCLARNMDWALPETTGTHTVLLRFYKGNRSYLSIGVVGLVGVLSAMREGYWAISLNQAPVPRGSINLFGGMPALQHVRKVCDQFSGYRDVVARLQKTQTMSPFFTHVIGTKPSEHVVVTSFGSHFQTRQVEQLPMVQTNHFVEPEFEYLNGEYDDSDEEILGPAYPSSESRYDALERRFAKNTPKSLPAALDMLKRTPVTNMLTMQSMAFCPANGEYKLRVQKL